MKLSAGVLSERNFRLLFFARTISFFGTNLAPIAVAFAVLDLTGSATDVGIAFACWTLAQISTLLVGGVVADRLPRRVEHRLRDVDADEPARMTDEAEVPSGAASEVERVDGRIEAIANGAEPSAQPRDRVVVRRLVARAIPRGVFAVIHFRGPRAPLAGGGGHANSSSAATNRTSLNREA